MRITITAATTATSGPKKYSQNPIARCTSCSRNPSAIADVWTWSMASETAAAVITSTSVNPISAPAAIPAPRCPPARANGTAMQRPT